MARIGPVEQGDVAALEALLVREPAVNIFQLDALGWRSRSRDQISPPGSTFYGSFNETGGLDGALFVVGDGRLVVPTSNVEAAAEFGRRFREIGRIRRVVGPRRAADALWEAYGPEPTRLFRDHLLYECCDAPTSYREPGLRPALESELSQVVQVTAAMHREELGMDPLAEAPESFERSVAVRIERQCTYVALVENRLVFKAEVGARCGYGAQIEGVYTIPEYRGRGIAARCLGELVCRLLPHLPRVTLHVNEQNVSAIKLYDRLGFQEICPFRLIAVE